MKGSSGKADLILIHNASQLITVDSEGERFKRGKEQGRITIVENGSVLIGERVEWVGRALDFNFKLYPEIEIFDATGKVVMPGFVDSHTHLVFAGTRENEFEMRIEGYSYQQIAKLGGGIRKTVELTRKASKEELKRIASGYLERALRNGTTSIEIKSGYGLELESEIKILEVANELNGKPMNIIPTFLGAHAIPSGEDKNKYVEDVINMLTEVSERKLARFCDVFCEDGYFSSEDSERILREAKRYGLLPKIHAEQFSNSGGVDVGLKLGAVSIDHLENVKDEDIEKMSKSDSVAVLLPGVSFFLDYKYPPARKLIDKGVPVAIATDFNPGSCMALSMQLMMTIACVKMKMKVEEAIVSATLNSAAAVGISNEAGSIEPGKRADIIVMDVPDYRVIPYFFGENHVQAVFIGGKLRYVKN